MLKARAFIPQLKILIPELNFIWIPSTSQKSWITYTIVETNISGQSLSNQVQKYNFWCPEKLDLDNLSHIFLITQFLDFLKKQKSCLLLIRNMEIPENRAAPILYLSFYHYKRQIKKRENRRPFLCLHEHYAFCIYLHCLLQFYMNFSEEKS